MRALPSLNSGALNGYRPSLGTTVQDAVQSLTNCVNLHPSEGGILSYKVRDIVNEDFTNKQAFFVGCLATANVQNCTIIGKDNYEALVLTSLVSSVEGFESYSLIKAFCFMSNDTTPPMRDVYAARIKEASLLITSLTRSARRMHNRKPATVLAKTFSNELWERAGRKHAIFGRPLFNLDNQIVFLVAGLSQQEAALIVETILEKNPTKKIRVYCQNEAIFRGVNDAVTNQPKIMLRDTYLKNIASQGGSTFCEVGLHLPEGNLQDLKRHQRLLKNIKGDVKIKQDIESSSSDSFSDFSQPFMD